MGELWTWPNPPGGCSIVVNDLNGWLMNFWEVLKGEDTFERFKRQIEATPFSQKEFEIAREHIGDGTRFAQASDLDRVEAARLFFIVARQSRSGLIKSFAPFSRNRLRRGINEQVSAWLTAIDGLPDVHSFLRPIVITNLPAVQLIEREDEKKTLFYLDPPYHPESVACANAYGSFGMTAADHDVLLEVIKKCAGKVMISGYRCPVYDKALAKWHRFDFDLPNNAASGKAKRRMVESVWCNFKPKKLDALADDK